MGDCEYCGGDGFATCQHCTPDTCETCSWCDGTGLDEPCPECGGSGEASYEPIAYDLDGYPYDPTEPSSDWYENLNIQV